MADVDLHLKIGEIKERFEKLMIQVQAVILYKNVTIHRNKSVVLGK